MWTSCQEEFGNQSLRYHWHPLRGLTREEEAEFLDKLIAGIKATYRTNLSLAISTERWTRIEPPTTAKNLILVGGAVATKLYNVAPDHNQECSLVKLNSNNTHEIRMAADLLRQLAGTRGCYNNDTLVVFHIFDEVAYSSKDGR